MNTYEVPFNELAIDINEIYKRLGYGDVYPTEEIQAMVQEMVKNISNVCKPMYVIFKLMLKPLLCNC